MVGSEGEMSSWAPSVACRLRGAGNCADEEFRRRCDDSPAPGEDEEETDLLILEVARSEVN
jgi:hypothetical protein